jgi:HPt (histidine-containing phosphotransfer) domain-containing protein
MSTHLPESKINSIFASDPAVAETLHFFFEHLNKASSELEVGLKSEDWPTIGQIAHRLKGSAGSFGYPGLADISMKLEKHVQSANHVGAAMAVQEIVAMKESIVQ